MTSAGWLKPPRYGVTDPWLNLDIPLALVRKVIARLKIEAEMAAARDRLNRQRDALADYGLRLDHHKNQLVAVDGNYDGWAPADFDG